MPEPTARQRIENLWDRAFPVGPLLDAYRDQVLTEAANLVADVRDQQYQPLDFKAERHALNRAHAALLAARTSQESRP